MNEEHKQLAKQNITSGIKWGLAISTIPFVLHYVLQFLF